jgi:hypothetical protein
MLNDCENMIYRETIGARETGCYNEEENYRICSYIKYIILVKI